jgi:drug/metabolite transporter (DMT)-like permease
MGILSSGIAYTLQIIGQKYTDPALASIVMSLESVVAALGGWLILENTLTARELFGCILVFLAILLAQIRLPIGRKTK